MTDDKLLHAISDMMNKKLNSELIPLKNELQETEQEIYKNYKDYADKTEVVFDNIEVMKKVL